MSASFYDLLKYAKTGLASPDMTAYDKMRALAMAGGGAIKTLKGVPPLSFRANGKPLISWSMLGNGQQTGTPSPDNIVMPEMCGERTVNLANMYGIDATGLNLIFKTDSNMTIKINGIKEDGANIRELVHPNIMLSAGKYTLKIKMISGSITNITGGVMFGINKNTYSMRTAPQVNTIGQEGTKTFTLTKDMLLTSLDITPSYGDAGAIFDNAVFQCWLYSGSDDKDYEPYGWKIPVTNAGQTVPVYLGEVPTVRRIRKLVLTGDEEWQLWNKNYFSPAIDRKGAINTILCTHFFNSISQGISYERQSSSGLRIASIAVPFVSSVNDLTTWLASQYANGAPVCVWYVLATPKTAIVNEPLCKIGDYADELHSTDSGVTILTAKGQNTLTVDTDLKPSEMTITYKE